MLEFLKSTAKLEKAVREWHYQNSIDGQPVSEYATCRQVSDDLDLVMVAQTVGALSLSGIKRAEVMKQMGDQYISIRETMHYYNGYKLVQQLGERKGWNVSYQGTMLTGYTCNIS